MTIIATEFPDYDLTTLPDDIPAFMKCAAWGNDTCPVWVGAGGALELWIDYENPADREFPQSERYCVMFNDDEVYAGDDWALALVQLNRFGG